MRVRERERVCVCVCVIEWERGIESEIETLPLLKSPIDSSAELLVLLLLIEMPPATAPMTMIRNTRPIISNCCVTGKEFINFGVET